MTRNLLVAAALAGCATQAPAVPAEEEAAGAVGTVSTASPVGRPVAPRPTPSKASRSRRTADPHGTGSHTLNWAALRECENSGSYRSKPGEYYRGAYQFDRQTWQSVGGSGDPADASPAEQDMRAHRLYEARGRQPWPRCGSRL